MRHTPLTAALALALASAAPAVIIDSGDGTGNTTAPVPDPGWSNVGRRGGTTGVYVGGRFALTAHHSGVGDIAFGNATYAYVPGTAVQLDNGDGTYADLVMFQIHPAPPLPALPIATVSPSAGAALILAGNGRNRGPAISFDPNGPLAPDPVGGYEWGPGQSVRWGTNSVTDTLLVSLLDGTQTRAIQTGFDDGGSAHETQAATGDSGGAAFAWNGSQWELVGILFAVGAAYSNQPAETVLYGNVTFSADLSFYRDEILEVMTMPEPSRGLWAGIAAVAVLARLRRVRRDAARFAPFTAALALTLASAASAVIIDSGDGSGNGYPLDPEPSWSWRNVGTIGGLSGVYLGGKFVLTPAHVGAGNVVLDGVTYTYVPGTAVQLDNGDDPATYADLLMFEIYPEPPLPALTIASTPPPPLPTTQLILVGHGPNRGPATSWDPPGPNGPYDGYQWGAGKTMRWGTNERWMASRS